MTWAMDLLPLLMFVTLFLLIFSGFPVAFVLGGVGVIFGFVGMGFGFFSWIEFFATVTRIWGGVAENLTLIAIPLFIFMGSILDSSGVANDLLLLLKRLLRRMPGGLGIAVVVMGTVLAATTGIVGASVTLMTLLAYPVLVRSHYPSSVAGGVIAASGTLGILLPPSVMLIVLANTFAIPVGNLFLGAVLPGLLLSLAYALFMMLLGLMGKVGRPGASVSSAPSFPGDNDEDGFPRGLWLVVLRGLVAPVVLIAFVLGSIFTGVATPTEAAGMGVLGAVLVALVNGKLRVAAVWKSCLSSGLICGMIFMIFMGAAVFSYVFRSLGGDDAVADVVQSFGLEGWHIIVLMMIVVFIMGCFLDWIEITLIIVPIFMPLLAGVDLFPGMDQTSFLVWLAICLSVNLQTSFITPPFGFSLFFVRGAAGPSLATAAIYRGIIPFVVLQLLVLALVLMVPEMVLWLPDKYLN